MSKTIQRGVKALETVYDFYKGRLNRATKTKIKISSVYTMTEK